jgi:glycogen operon protein
LRVDHIVFHRGRFFQGATIPGTEVKDVTWLRADGEEMSEADWADAHARMLCLLLLSGEAGSCIRPSAAKRKPKTPSS